MRKKCCDATAFTFYMQLYSQRGWQRAEKTNQGSPPRPQCSLSAKPSPSFKIRLPTSSQTTNNQQLPTGSTCNKTSELTPLRLNSTRMTPNPIELDRVSGRPKASHSSQSASNAKQQSAIDYRQMTARTADPQLLHRGQGDSDDVRALQEDIEALRADNEQLRALIISRSMAREPIQGEEFYFKEFRQLLTDVQEWVAKLDLSGGVKELPVDRANEIIKLLGAIGPRGKSSAEFLREKRALFEKACRSPKSRIQLERHIVAAILFDKVFAPLVFGIPREWTQTLDGILEIIETTEPDSDFNTVLMVSRSLRLSTAILWKDEISKAEAQLTSQMIAIVRQLFPYHDEEKLLKGMRKVITKALLVKRQMSQEKLLYYCYWESGGKEFDAKEMQLSGSEQARGNVAFCTFPGLLRISLNLKAKQPNIIMKASVLLQSDIS